MGFRTRLLLLSLIVFAATPARADFAAGLDAYERGDYGVALEEWRPLGEEGNSKAAFRLGLMYLNGHGVPKDDEMAREWLDKAGKHGTSAMQREVAKVYEKNKSLKSLFFSNSPLHRDLDLLGEAARGGDDEAIYLFALSYEYGHNLKKYRFGIGLNAKPRLAESFYLMVAEKGYAPAQSALAAMYHFGNGVPWDDMKALEWAQKAALRENPRAYSILGGIFYSSESFEENKIEALKWFILAAGKGHPVGTIFQRLIEQEMPRAEVSAARRLAENWSSQSRRRFIKPLISRNLPSLVLIEPAKSRKNYRIALNELRRRLDAAYERGDQGEVEGIIGDLEEFIDDS